MPEKTLRIVCPRCRHPQDVEVRPGATEVITCDGVTYSHPRRLNETDQACRALLAVERSESAPETFVVREQVLGR